MESGSFVRKNLSRDNRRESVAATPAHRGSAEMPTGKRNRLVERQHGSRSGDLRSTVARRFMRMLRAHDRARVELLAAYAPEAK